MLGDRCTMISQDDKAKVPVGILAVSRTFAMVQSSSTTISVPNHDFPVGPNHKLIPSFYLFMKRKDEADEGGMKQGQLACFVRPQLFSGSSSRSHMADIMTMTQEPSTRPLMMKAGDVRPVMFIITDGGPDENPRHFKNITEFGHLFRMLVLDYLSVRCYAAGPSAMNPVERAMSSFSSKLIGVVLPHDHHGNHIVSDRKSVSDIGLAKLNMKYTANS